MEIICNANQSVLSILRNFVKKDNCTRWIHYSVQLQVDNGVLIFNLLTRELIYLSRDEYTHYTELEYLKEHWFLVPEETKEKEFADFVRLVLRNRKNKSNEITGYTIFTTTDCNARCFYCFELGRSRIPMSNETAYKVASYIVAHCGKKKVNICWFGGEPLFNIDAIEIICRELKSKNVQFVSRMVSNGFLFNDEIVNEAVCDWYLKSVQITLDGTEKIYNKTKAFIYRDCNPYKIVIDNIDRLLAAGISVSIRLNMDLYNADDLLTLSEELGQRFANNDKLSVYAHHLFDADLSMAEMHDDVEWEKRDVAMRRLTNCLDQNGLLGRSGVSKNIKLNYCKADSGSAVTILPDGSIGLCEHFSEDEFIGHIDCNEFDSAVMASWKETMPEIPECAECFYYLDCIKLKKCVNGRDCYRQFRKERLRSTQRKMLCSFEQWQSKTFYESNDINDDC